MSDYISRDAALTALQNPELFNVSPRFLQILRDLPAADVEPVRHGRWERSILAYDFKRCSECSSVWSRTSNYCPNCGAKMDGGTDNG